VRGSYRIVDVDGKEIECSRRTIALCRCGRSAQKPLCDGTHGLSTNLKDLARMQRPDPPG
jgi:CDGSH-type Zn-finger protein